MSVGPRNDDIVVTKTAGAQISYVVPSVHLQTSVDKKTVYKCYHNDSRIQSRLNT
mgnify:CR=1 FL=1